MYVYLSGLLARTGFVWLLLLKYERYHHRFNTTSVFVERRINTFDIVTKCDLIFNATISAKTNINPIEIKERKPASRNSVLVARAAFASQS